jgi:hypothetical protein
VPADYRGIREENIARYGWDTAVLDLLGQLYSERTHFIFELIQNAEDAGATEVAFELFTDRLELRHDGRPFTEADVRGVCGVGQSGKTAELTGRGRALQDRELRPASSRAAGRAGAVAHAVRVPVRP